MKRKIDLTGPEGNAFVLLGYAEKLCNGHDIDWNVVKPEMLASDYTNLVNVFEKYFGEWVELIKF